MKWTRILFVGVVLAAMSCAVTATASARSTSAQGVGTVNLAKTARGRILVSSTGFTLYQFTRDSSGTDTCVGIEGCTGIWPPLLVTGTPTAGAGVKASLLSTITLPDGASQVTYAGHPLYMYIQDEAPGETGYIGAREFGGFWYGVKRNARAVK
jgi:predicted lipoprotein with Yx(FWY)xxD motif